MTVNVQKMSKFPKYRGGEEEDAMNNSFLMNLSIGLECLCCECSCRVVVFNFDIDTIKNTQYSENLSPPKIGMLLRNHGINTESVTC